MGTALYARLLRSDVEEHGFGFAARAALQPDVEPPTAIALGLGEQGGAARSMLVRGLLRVGLVERVADKIGARHEGLEKTARMQADGEMGRLLGVAAAGYRPRFHRLEAELAALIGAASSASRR